ncbi:MAG: c-type cytochrome domain-containing protein, partial [Pirellulaceae bacterium]
MKKSTRSKIQFMAGAVVGLLVWLVLCSFVPAQEPAAADKVTFDDHVKSIFRQRCAACHSPDKKSGGLDLTNFTALMQGGSSGASIEPGDSDGSYLFMLVTHEEEPKMPPDGTKIPEEELNVLKKWIDAGALENMASKAKIKKKKFDMAIAGNAAERPAQVALPPHLPLEPIVHTPKTSCSTAVAVSPWAPVAAVASPKQILLYHTQSLELIGVLAFPEGIANVLKFSSDGRLLLAGGGRDAVSGKVVVWDVASGKRQLEVGDELDTVLGADISSDFKWIALGGPSKVVRVFSTRDGSLAYECKKHTDWITSLAFSPDGVLLASGDRGGNAFVWEAPTGNEYLALRGHTDRINSISWRIDSNIVATASQDTTVRLWEMNNGSQVKSWGAHGGGVTAVSFTREGNLVTNGRDRVAKIWNQNGEAQKQFPALPDIGTTVAYCHETQRVIAGDWTGKVMIANVADGAAVGELAMNPLPLANRLASAQTTLQAAAAEHQPVAAELVAVTQQMTALQTQLNEANTAKQNLATEMTTTEKVVVDTKTVLDTKLAQKAQMQVEMDEKAKLLPSLTELAEKAVAVAAISPQDPELQASAAGLTQKQAGTKARV